MHTHCRIEVCNAASGYPGAPDGRSSSISDLHVREQSCTLSAQLAIVAKGCLFIAEELDVV